MCPQKCRGVCRRQRILICVYYFAKSNDCSRSTSAKQNVAVLNCGLATISKYFNNILHEIARVFSLFVVMVTACKSQNVSIFFLIPPIAPNGGVPPTCPLYQVCERYHFKNQSVNIATQPYKSLAAASYHRSLLPRLGHCESQQTHAFQNAIRRRQPLHCGIQRKYIVRDAFLNFS